jgi:hypothetical protein
MIKTFLSLAAVAILTVAAPALAAETQTITRDGVTYVYSVQETPKATLIKGYEQGGKPFSLRVANGRVNGHANGGYVSFAVSSVVRTGAAAPMPIEISSK